MTLLLDAVLVAVVTAAALKRNRICCVRSCDAVQ